MFEFLFEKQNDREQAKIRIREISVKLDGFEASFLVQQTFDIKRHGICPAGKVLRGIISPGKKVYLSGFEGTLESIETKGKILERAGEGDFVALKIKGLEMPIKRGDLLHFKP